MSNGEYTDLEDFFFTYPGLQVVKKIDSNGINLWFIHGLVKVEVRNLLILFLRLLLFIFNNSIFAL